MPLAPKVDTVSSSVPPVLEQSAGMLVKRESPITCTGRECAVSPAICMSAVTTGPQLKPSTNCVHSARELPFANVSIGSVSVKTGAKMRRP